MSLGPNSSNRSLHRRFLRLPSASALSALLIFATFNVAENAAQTGAGQQPDVLGPIVGPPVLPVAADVDLRSLPLSAKATNAPGKGPKEVPRGANSWHVPDFGFIEPDEMAQEAGEAPVQRSLTGPLVNFDGIAFTGAFPPDPIGDVGPNHYVQAVNVSFAVYNKSGGLLAGPSDINSLWNGQGGICEANNDGDPVVLYDPLANRWIISQFAFPAHVCIAVSKTASPIAGGYNLYEFNVSQFPDYFKLGVWPDAYYMAANFGNSVAVVAFNRTAMLAGNAAGFVQFTAPGLPGLGGNMLLPSDLDGPTPPPAGSPNYFYRQVDGNNFGGVDRLELFQFHVNFANPNQSTFTGPTSIPTSAFDSALCGFFSFACVPQPGTGVTLDPINEWPMWRLQYRNRGTHQALVGNFVVDVNGNDLHGIRWFELRKTTGNWFLQQDGTFAPQPGGAAVHRWIGSAAMDKDNNIAIGYSVSGTSVFPSIRYAARQAGDPAGQMSQGEQTLVVGGKSQTNTTRWGDYSSLNVDPSDDCTFWYTNEYMPSVGNWRTRIGSFRLTTCGGGTGGQPNLVISNIQAPNKAGANQTINVKVTTANNGTAGAGASTGRVWLSTNQTLDGMDDLIGSVAVPALAAGASDIGTASSTIPNGTTPGKYFLIAEADGLTAVAESNENDNEKTKVIYIGPDYTVTSLTAPSTIPVGTMFTISDTTKNVGGQAAGGNTTTRFWLSLNKTVGPGDIVLGSRVVPPLNAGQSNSGSTNVTMPSTPPGPYYILAVADALNGLAESKENNNKKVKAVTVP